MDENNSPEKKNIIKKISDHSKSDSIKSKVIWSVVFVLIAALTIFAITSQGGFSFSEFISFLSSLDPFWVVMAFASMLGIILFEGLAIITIVRSMGYKKHLGHGYIYASGDIYFSAITPSATGGQPASAFFMMKDGIPGPTVTVTLVVNLIMYTFGILILGVIAFILNPSMFLGFSFVSKAFIIVGSVSLCAVAACFIIILVKSSILYAICDWVLDFLARIRIIRKLEPKKRKLREAIDSYAHHVSDLGDKRVMLLKVLIFNILQRASVIAVTLFVFYAQGGAAESGVNVWVAQCMVILGSNTVPIPGAMGISDFLLIDAFGALGFADGAAMNLNLLSRAISFYTCVILCGASMIVRAISYKVIASNQKKRFAAYDGEATKNDD